MKSLATLAVALLIALGGCGYQDFKRPLVRNYAADLFYKPQRPPETAGAEDVKIYELARTLARWNEASASAQQPYKVGPGDVLKVSIIAVDAGEPDLAPELTVTPKGDVACPVLGQVPVAGLSTAQIEKKLDALCRQGYYRSPVVSVAVTQYRSKRVYVTGAVAAAGMLTLEANQTSLLDVLLRSGGPGEDAGGTAVVTRAAPPVEGQDGAMEPQTIRVDLDGLVERLDVAQNITIYPGDIVYVEPMHENYFYVFGFVGAPGAYKLPRHDQVGVMDAVAFARGLSESGRPDKTRLLRKTPDGVKAYDIDLSRVGAGREPDILVQPGDRIIVGTSWVRRSIDGLLHVLGIRSLVPTY